MSNLISGAYNEETFMDQPQIMWFYLSYTWAWSGLFCICNSQFSIFGGGGEYQTMYTSLSYMQTWEFTSCLREGCNSFFLCFQWPQFCPSWSDGLGVWPPSEEADRGVWASHKGKFLERVENSSGRSTLSPSLTLEIHLFFSTGCEWSPAFFALSVCPKEPGGWAVA